MGKVRELKQEDGKGIWLCGGGELAGALFAEIDELVVELAPMAIGSGTPLFGQKQPFDPTFFTLTDSTIMDSGTVFLTYARK
ncbi:dihydrofolate reductase family protein [Streptomyces sp. NPDC055099]